MFIKKEFIKPDKIEFREYQISIANSSYNKNSLVVLPTGLGKTIIALLLIAKELKNNKDKILFLAPTKPLVMQHRNFLIKYLTIDDKYITIFTGETPPNKRREIWKKSRIIVSTPQVIENDILSGRINIDQFCLIIFDEAHHAVGEYSYVFISKMYEKYRNNRRILGLTASPGNDITKILDVCKNLDISNIEIRTKYDRDIKPYIHDLKIRWEKVILPDDFSYIIQLFRKTLSERLKILKDVNAIDSSSISLVNRTKLLEAQNRIQKKIRSTMKPSKILFKAASIQSEALKIHYAIEILQTQGVNSLRYYFERIKTEAISKGGSKASKAIMSDYNIIDALSYIKSINIEHPKIEAVIRIVKKQFEKNKDSKIIIFTHYRDTSTYITKILEGLERIRPIRFIGQTSRNNDKGLSQKEQSYLIDKFKNGTYNVLIATSVAEEGLDIPSTELVIFYEPIPSEIRNIQRRGRAGRKMPGEVIILITKATPDEGYYWASKRRERRMRSELEFLRSKLQKRLEDTKTFNFQNVVKNNNQKTLEDFNIKNKSLKIFVDNREYRSNVVRNLMKKGIFIESKQLEIGDYILSSRIGVERKNVDDYLESLIEGKLFKQISNLREIYSRPVLILEGEGLLTKRNINHNAIFGSLASINVDFGVPILSTKNASETADLLIIMAKKEQREDKKSISFRKEKKTIPLSDKQQFVIEGLPSVSAILAKRLLDHFGTIRDIINASEEELMEVKGIGKNISTEILELINARYLLK